MYNSDSESDYSGSIDDDRGSFSSRSPAFEDESLNTSHSALYLQSADCTVRFKSHHKSKHRNLTKFTEIDESFSGEVWIQGLMEGGYSDLSIEEKLDALVSLVDLTSSGFNFGRQVKYVSMLYHVIAQKINCFSSFQITFFCLVFFCRIQS